MNLLSIAVERNGAILRNTEVVAVGCASVLSVGLCESIPFVSSPMPC